jgi:acyl-CoA thioester hydrolase
MGPERGQVTMNVAEFPSRLTAVITLQIPFHDVDSARVVWHGHYFKYFEVARCALLDRIGYNYRDMADSGIVWPIVKTNAKFLLPLVFNQVVKVAATLREWDMQIVMDYRIEDENGVLYTKASTTQVPLDALTYELQFGTPGFLLDRIKEYLDGG